MQSDRGSDRFYLAPLQTNSPPNHVFAVRLAGATLHGLTPTFGVQTPYEESRTIMSNNKGSKIQIQGFAVCQVGQLIGHDADECRANKVVGGGVLCYVCGRVYPDFGATELSIIKAIADARPGFPSMSAPVVSFGSAIADEPDSAEFRAACLSGHDPKLVDTVRLGFAFGRYAYERVNVCYDGNDLSAAKSPDLSIGRLYNGFEYGAVPESIDKAAAALSDLGFRVTNQPGDGLLRSIIMVLGQRVVPGKDALQGIKVELSWQLV